MLETHGRTLEQYQLFFSFMEKAMSFEVKQKNSRLVHLLQSPRRNRQRLWPGFQGCDHPFTALLQTTEIVEQTYEAPGICFRY